MTARLSGLDHRICYAVKANSNLAILRVLAGLGAGFDIVSEGELGRVAAAGGVPWLCASFAGVGKTEGEIKTALRRGIYCFNAESEPELERITRVAARNEKESASVAVRINPNIDAHTHAKVTTDGYENKFASSSSGSRRYMRRRARLKNLRLRGVQMHIGSQLTDVAPFEAAVKKALPLVRELTALYGLEFFSIGGGLGIVYKPALASGSEQCGGARRMEARS